MTRHTRRDLKKLFMNKIAVFTSLFGEKDNIIPVDRSFVEGADWFLFTNRDIESETHQVIKCDNGGLTNRRASREYKIAPHRYLPNYEYHIYIDANMELLVSPEHLISTYLEKDIAVLVHQWRDCIYEEMKECLRLKVADLDLSHEQAKLYRRLGYPEHWGLTENGVILRRNTEPVRLFNELWKFIYQAFAERDQFSFCFVSWYTGIEYSIIENTIRKKNPYLFKLHPHL